MNIITKHLFAGILLFAGVSQSRAMLVGTTWADVTPVPEPAAAVLGGVGLLALLLWRRWHRLRR